MNVLAALAAISIGGAPGPQAPVVSPAKVEHATAVKDLLIRQLMALPAVVGAGIGASSAQAGEAAIVLYASRELTARERRTIPKELDGVRVEVVVSGPISERGGKGRKE